MISVSLEGQLPEELNLDVDAILRECASTVMGMMRMRVHEQGKASDGSQIGTYSKGYMIVRSGNFKNNKKNRGDGYQKAGRQTGNYTKGSSAGSKRKYYNRGSDSRVILSLTRQMENDMRAVSDGKDYVIRYSNDFNYNKAMWNEKRYKKPIWDLSEEEQATVNAIVERHINDATNGK